MSLFYPLHFIYCSPTYQICFLVLRDFVVNSNDRVIRVFSVKDDGPPEQLHKFQDLVNRIQWNQCCLSNDSDYVIGGSAHQAEHNIYIWDKIGGNLVKILEGPKEPLEDVAVSYLSLVFSRQQKGTSKSNILFFLHEISGTLYDPSLHLSRTLERYTSGRPTTRRIGVHLHQTSRNWKKISIMRNGKTSSIL